MANSLSVLSALLLTSLLASCGGGSGSGSSGPTAVLNGVVAVGAALPAVTVTVTDANGNKAFAQTNSDGSYSVYDPAGTTLTAPFSVQVKSLLGTSEVSLSSFALDRGVVSNVTPLTTAVSALLNSSNAYDPASLDVSQLTTTTVAAASQTLATALNPLLTAASVDPSQFDPVKGKFTANSEGIDSVMDRLAVNYTGSGITMVNRFEVVADAAPITQVSVNSSGVTGTLPAGMAPPSASTLTAFSQQLTNCFKVAAASRVAYTTNGAGRNIFTPGSVHASCTAFVDSAYRSQGQAFGQKWLSHLSNADFDGSTQVILVPQYVVDRSGNTPVWTGDDQIAYVYNINLVDKNNLTYTMPDVLAKVSNQFVIRGNQRKFDVSIQSTFSKLIDNNGANNRIEGRLRIGLDPTLVPDGSGFGTYQTTTDGSKPLPKILCAWVTGPLLQQDETHDTANPMGGVLMVPPHSDLTTRRDYSAVRIKYPVGFDPVNNPIHQSRLYNDCKSTHTVGTNREVASAETNNQFTIDVVKTDAASTSVFRSYTALNAAQAYPTSLMRAGYCPTINNRGVDTHTPLITATTVDGWCNSTKREDMVGSSLRTAFETRYKDPKDIQYTFYIFVDSAYSEVAPQTAYASLNTKAAFMASAEKVNVRMVGALPFLDKATVAGSTVFAGNQQFRGVGPAMVNTYLAAGAATIASGTSVSGSWTIPAGSEGIDRLGISGWFIKSTDGSRIGAATYSDSFGLPRSLLQSNFILSEDWYGYDYATYSNERFAAMATSAYREVWVRSYDRSNRQIQTVEYAIR